MKWKMGANASSIAVAQAHRSQPDRVTVRLEAMGVQ